MQECLDNFAAWADYWQLQVAENKCCVLTLGSQIPPSYTIKHVNLVNVSEYRDLGVLVEKNCLYRQHISTVCHKAYRTINVIFRCFHTANQYALLRAYRSHVLPLLEYCSTVWNPFIYSGHYLGMTDQLENVQRLFTRRLYSRCQLDCNHGYIERLDYLKLDSLELRRIHRDLIMVYKILHGIVYTPNNNVLLPLIGAPGTVVSTRGHKYKIKSMSFRLDIKKNHFCNRVVNIWNGLPDSTASSSSSLRFKQALRSIDLSHAVKLNRF